MIHTPFTVRGGGERQILTLAVELGKRGHEVEIFTNGMDKNSFPEFFSKVKINVIPHPFLGKLSTLRTHQVHPSVSQTSREKKSAGIGKWMLTVRRHLVRQQYVSSLPAMIELGRKIPKKFDVINIHNFPTEWAGFVAKNRLKVPLVWMCNEPPYWFFVPEERRGVFGRTNWPLFELWDKTAVDYVDSIMVLSHVGEDIVKKAYDKSSTIVRTGAYIPLIDKPSGRELRRKHGLENDFVILQAGGLDFIKRQFITIKALHLLSPKYNVKLILDGSGRRDYLIKLSEKLGLKDKVLFLCSKSDAELAEVYAACDVFVYPSLKSTWGLGPAEAMAAAKPVVVSKLVGVSEIIQDGVNGLVVDYPDAKSIAKKIELLLLNPELRQMLGQNAYNYVKNDLSWERYAQKVESIFQETLLRSKRK
jgi:glycosyltransferase involved in cell wall biosynthesis